MGKDWDHGIPGVAFWEAALRVAKPGAFLLAFGGTRTYHRLTCAIEDAGWEIRDCMLWVYGSGFPKSHDISKAIDKAAGAEREVVGINADYLRRKPNGMKTDGATAYGYSQKQQDTDPSITAPATEAAKLWDGWGTALKPAYEPIIVAMKPLDGTFANNALTHGVAGLNIDGGRIGTSGARNNGRKKDSEIYGDFGPTERVDYDKGRWPANVILDEAAGEMLDEQSGENPSRFFYCAKASRSERGECNHHPTVKPLDLMAYLCKLTMTPTGGTVLDPFCGSGSTIVAAIQVGREAIGIEKNPEYSEIARARVSHARGPLFGAAESEGE
jgi:DNA modification methylase